MRLLYFGCACAWLLVLDLYDVCQAGPPCIGYMPISKRQIVWAAAGRDFPPPLTTESPTTHTTDQHHVPMDPRAAELMPIHAARLALTRSVTQKAVDPSMGPALRVRLTARAASARGCPPYCTLARPTAQCRLSSLRLSLANAHPRRFGSVVLAGRPPCRARRCAAHGCRRHGAHNPEQGRRPWGDRLPPGSAARQGEGHGGDGAARRPEPGQAAAQRLRRPRCGGRQGDMVR